MELARIDEKISEYNLIESLAMYLPKAGSLNFFVYPIIKYLDEGMSVL